LRRHARYPACSSPSRPGVGSSFAHRVARRATGGLWPAGVGGSGYRVVAHCLVRAARGGKRAARRVSSSGASRLRAAYAPRPALPVHQRCLSNRTKRATASELVGTSCATRARFVLCQERLE
jgi:hypothetical protein